MNFIQTIHRLKTYWQKQGCYIEESKDLPMGAATFHPTCFFGSLRTEPHKVAYMQKCVRPDDVRGGENLDRLYQFHQFQVLLRPIPNKVLTLYYDSLRYIGIDLGQFDSLLLADDWKSLSLGAYGYGAEHRVNGLEICQLTYFAKMGGCKVRPIFEIAYGIERCLSLLHDDMMNIPWDQNKSYGDLFLEYERCMAGKKMDYDTLVCLFRNCHKMSNLLIGRPRAAYDFFIQANYYLNLLDSTGQLAPDLRQSMLVDLITSIKNISRHFVSANGCILP